MFTTQDPTHCPDCMSKDIILGDRVYKKDAFGEETDIIILGTWFCNKCGNLIGRKISRYENDLNENSL